MGKLYQKINGSAKPISGSDGEWHEFCKNNTSTIISLSEIDYKELYVGVSVSNLDIGGTAIPFTFLKGVSLKVRSGYYANSSNYAFADVDYDAENDTLTVEYNYNGSDASTKYTFVYYR